jgi:adenylate cyclase
LAAILAADVVGYSRLMGQDETRTLTAVRRLLAEVIEPCLSEHQGRLFKSMGDGFLVEFPSVVNAVACAAAIQKAMVARNADLPEDRTIQLRIGVNLGDVIVEGDDIFGDGVNVAARLEGLAPPGETVVSASAHDQIGNRLDLSFEDMGEKQLKNITKPLRIYRLAASTRPAAPAVAPERTKSSIAVLPFTNMSSDADQEYFADGLTEDIITELARFSSLTVIARNTSFQYRDRSQDMKKVGHELGVRYLVEGSVRKLGSHIRITAQLIDASTGHHVWAERYDRRLEELFAVQDEVIRSIVTTTEHRLTDNETEVATRRSPNSWVAHDFYLQARRFLNSYETYDKAEAPLLRAIELDPLMAEAHAKLAHFMIGKYLDALDDSHIAAADASARRALSINNGSSDAHNAMSTVYAYQDQMDKAILHADRALTLNPHDTFAATSRAQWLIFAGRFAEGLADLERIVERDPVPPTWYWDTKGAALFQLRRYQEAIDSYAMVEKQQVWEMGYLAASTALMGRMSEARAHVAQILTVAPSMNISKMAKFERYQTEDAKDHFAEGLRKAGLPE